MKLKKKRFKKLTASLFLSAALLLPALPTSAADNPFSILDDNELPVVYITIDENAEGFGTIEEMNSSDDHSVKCTGTIKIDVPDGYMGDYSDTVLSDTDELQLDYIRGRGNITWTADKKPYKIKLDKKEELLGMGKNKHWALLANRFDVSLLRNRLACYVGERLGFEYTPKMLPVDLVMNGEYQGSYFLSETVRIAGSRVDIDELTPEDNSESELSGGYLLALDPIYYVNEIDMHNTNNTRRGVTFWFENPEFYNQDGDAAGTTEQKEYIVNYLNSVEEAIFSDDFRNSEGKLYSDLMDIKSAADFWWAQEFFINDDAFTTTSNYLYKKRNEKLYWGPLWDFDYSMGQLEPETEGFNQASMLWLDHLRAYNPEYQQLLKERWQVLDSIVTDIIKDGGILDKYAQEQENSRKDNYQKWGSSPIALKFNHVYDEEIENIRRWLTERQNWVREHIDTDISNVYCTVKFVVDGEVISTFTPFLSTRLGITPEISRPENCIFEGWFDENGKKYDFNSPINSDVVLTPKFVSLVPTDPEESEVYEEPEVSEESEISEVSEVSEISEVSEVSEVSEISEASKDNAEPEPSQNSSQIVPSIPSDTPNTSNSSPVPFIAVSAFISLLAAVGAGIRKKKR